MSVQKFKPVFGDGVIKHAQKPYTLICNKPLQSCKNLAALGIWCYLQSLPENWRLSPAQLQKHFSIGRDKVYNLLNYLINTGLLGREVLRNPNGSIAQTDYIVFTGENYHEAQNAHPFPENQEVDIKSVAQPLPDLPDVGKSDTTNTTTHTNTNTNKNSCASVKERPDARLSENDDFDEFWKIYPNKKDKAKAKKRWEKIKPGDRALILAALKVQIAKDRQFQGDPQYIPLPSTYLNGRRWEDEIRVAQLRPIGNATTQPRNEIRSAVKDWAPGNPDYDRVNGHGGSRNDTRGSAIQIAR